MNQQYVIKPTNCREGQFKQTTTSEMDASDLEIGDQQIIIPMNAAIRIFYFVSRDDLENCKLVCRSWKTLIDYADKELPKRKIDALLLSTAREYSMGIYHGNVKKCFFYRKYFIDRDIDEIEITKDESEYFDSTKFRFPCGTPYPRIRTNMVFEIPDNFHHETCKSVRPIIYRHNRNYSKKLFTPPLAYYERLKKMLYRSEIQKLIFHGFTFTNLFVEKIFEYIKEPLLKIEQVVLHGCNLRYLTPQTFHLLLDGFHADAYYIEKSRFCLPDHISPPLFEKSSILLAKIIYIDYAIERNTGTAVTFPIDDEFILKLAKMLLNVGRIEREFFGVALSRVTQKIIKPYEQLALQSSAQFQNNGQFMMMKENDNRAEEHLNLRWLYKILLFGEIRCNLSNWQI